MDSFVNQQMTPVIIAFLIFQPKPVADGVTIRKGGSVAEKSGLPEFCGVSYKRTDDFPARDRTRFDMKMLAVFHDSEIENLRENVHFRGRLQVRVKNKVGPLKCPDSMRLKQFLIRRLMIEPVPPQKFAKP
jgi:hypothetical protein